MKKLLCVFLSAVMAFCAFVVSAPAVGAVSVSFDDMANAAAGIIMENEGSYKSVNPDDNGALSIGWLQWHANRALNLLKSIVSADTAAAKKILTDSLYKEITTAKDWSTRVLNSAEKTAISKLIDTPAGHSEQDKLAKKDISVYINHGMSLGITDPAALVFFADVENQCGGGGVNRVASAAMKKVGSYAKVGLGELYRASLEDASAGRYPARRDRTYSYCLLLGWDSIEGSYEVWTAKNTVNVRSGPGASYTLVSTLYAGNSTVIVSKRMVDGALWGKGYLGWICLDYCTYRIGSAPSPVIFDLCGGEAAGAAHQMTVDAINAGRGVNKLVAYTAEYGASNTPTNQYGAETAVGKDGKVTVAPVWGSCRLKIPDGGFVLSGHNTQGYFLTQNVFAGDYVYLDDALMKASVFKNKNSYLISSKTVSIDSKYGELPVCERDGYAFDGWYTEPSGGVRVTPSSLGSTHAGVTLYAHWRRAAASVVFVTDGGVIDGTAEQKLTAINGSRPTNSLVVYDSSYESTKTPTNEWGAEAAVDADGRVSVLPVWGSCKLTIPEGGFVLSGHNAMGDWLIQNIRDGSYATYDDVAKTVTVYKDKETYDAVNKTLTAGSAVGKLPTVSRQYYDFLGWYTESGAPATEKTVIPVGGLVLYARWEVRPGRLTLDAAGGEIKTAPETAKLSGTNIGRGANMLVLYKSRNKTGTNIHGAEALINSRGIVQMMFGYGVGNSTVPAGCTVLSGHGKMCTWVSANLKTGSYVRISGNTVSVYESYGAYLCSGTRTVKYGEAWGEMPTPERRGYVFAGWADPTGQTVTDTDTVSLYGDITLTARWTKVNTVTFDAAGGKLTDTAKVAVASGINTGRGSNALVIFTGVPATGTNIYGAEAIVGEDGFVTEIRGYGTGNSTVPKNGFVLSGHGTMFSWIKANLKVGSYVRVIGKTVYVYGSRLEYEAAKGRATVENGAAAAYVPTATKSGAQLAGWYKSDGSIFGTDTPVTEDITVTAKWHCSEAAAVFDTSGGEKIAAKAVAAISGTDVGRFANSLILYKTKKTTGTNGYGAEVLINGAGTVLAVFPYGCGNNAIPAGCTVLSGHGTMFSWIYANIKTGDYVRIDASKVSVYRSYQDYLAATGKKILKLGEKYGTLPVPVRDGYVFGGWVNSSGAVVSGTDIVTDCDNPTLTAVWKKASTLEFSANGGSLGATAVKAVDSTNAGRGANQLALFTGKSTTGTNIYGAEVIVGADGVVQNVYYYSGNHSVPVGGFVLSGHGSAARWLLDNVRTGSYVTVVGGRVKVYASKTDCDAESGRLTVAAGDAVSALPVPIKEGCTFGGWYTEDGAEFNVGDTAPDTNLRLFAKWNG